MHRLRIMIVRHRRLTAMVLAMALVLKAVIPAGFMLETGPHLLSVKICSDEAGRLSPVAIALPAAGKAHPGVADKSDSPCHFSVLGHATLGATDPALLAQALAFILALGFLGLVTVPRAPLAHLRPPPCGPPAAV